MERVWADGEDVLVWEHDIEGTRQAFDQALECPCEWSTSEYRGEHRSLYSGALGFTRFRSSIMREIPNAMTLALQDKSFGADQRDYLTMDAKLFAVLRDKGKLPHVHAEVPHHHQYPYGCGCGGDHE